MKSNNSLIEVGGIKFGYRGNFCFVLFYDSVVLDFQFCKLLDLYQELVDII